MTCFRLIHISDLHFATRPYILNSSFIYRSDLPGDPRVKASYELLQSSHDEDVVRRLRRFLSARVRSSAVEDHFDLVVVSGDLAATGLRSHLQVARGFIEGTASLPIEAQHHVAHCGVPSRKIFLMPGNHDRFKPAHPITKRIAEALEPGGVEFDVVFGDFWPSSADTVAKCKIGDCERKVVARCLPGKPGLCVVAADFCLRHEDDAEGIWNLRPFAYAGQGRVYKEVLDAIVDTTKTFQSQQPPTAVIWMIHFPPLLPTELATLEQWKRLIGAKHVIKAAKDAQVGLILAGHIHKDRMSI